MRFARQPWSRKREAVDVAVWKAPWPLLNAQPEETAMPARIVVTEFVSLDGVMEAPGGEPDFKVYEPQPIRSGTDGGSSLSARARRPLTLG